MDSRSKPQAKQDAEKLAAAWLDDVASGRRTMSQRKLSVIEQQLGGIATVRKLAKARGVHLLALEDDKGVELIAASTKSFRSIC